MSARRDVQTRLTLLALALGVSGQGCGTEDHEADAFPPPVTAACDVEGEPLLSEAVSFACVPPSIGEEFVARAEDRASFDAAIAPACSGAAGDALETLGADFATDAVYIIRDGVGSSFGLLQPWEGAGVYGNSAEAMVRIDLVDGGALCDTGTAEGGTRVVLVRVPREAAVTECVRFLDACLGS